MERRKPFFIAFLPSIIGSSPFRQPSFRSAMLVNGLTTCLMYLSWSPRLTRTQKENHIKVFSPSHRVFDVEPVFVPCLMFLVLQTALGLARTSNRSPRVSAVPLLLYLSSHRYHIVYLGAGEKCWAFTSHSCWQKQYCWLGANKWKLELPLPKLHYHNSRHWQNSLVKTRLSESLSVTIKEWVTPWFSVMSSKDLFNVSLSGF